MPQNIKNLFWNYDGDKVGKQNPKGNIQKTYTNRSLKHYQKNLGVRKFELCTSFHQPDESCNQGSVEGACETKK